MYTESKFFLPYQVVNGDNLLPQQQPVDKKAQTVRNKLLLLQLKMLSATKLAGQMCITQKKVRVI